MLQVFFEMAKLPNRQTSGQRILCLAGASCVISPCLNVAVCWLLLVQFVGSVGRIPVVITGMPREIPKAQ